MNDVKGKLSILIPKEVLEGETRVAATPETVKAMKEQGFNIVVESGAGDSASISDELFKDAGAVISSNIKKNYSDADIILAVNPPKKHPEAKKHQLELMKQGSSWISFFAPQSSPEIVSLFNKKKISSFSMNLIPRISRAQKMDALTSQSNIAGYKAVLMAAYEINKIFPLMMTAAGTMHPARVVILGAGVAGLQAIATAKRLGAQVEASDIRPAAKEQVESLGASFIEVPFDKDAEDTQGYAKQASKEFLKRQTEEVSKRVKQADIVITTALVPGRKAPVLVTESMVKSMKQGSVIVDMAAVQGGNCSLTEPGKTIEKNGVKIIGHANIPATVPVHASQMYAKNILNFLLTITKEGKLDFESDKEIIDATLVTKDGKVVHQQTAEALRGEKKK